ncbi:ATP-binding cassette transporter-like protein [Tothia fuscella]|uniref:ATP-binding cassette transporter-like protein n=1 Tax=Tothia fuscella TaxID=1048955 RepID=A0A9P4P5R1_9PEZI|nr:ATP-binding cassette transporter-like protein [Tothia fuscella]
MSSSNLHTDVEKTAGEYTQLFNTNIRSFAWRDITVSVKDRVTKQPKNILQNVDGVVRAGEMLALMGPSGSGKTTLLNVLAHRLAATGASVRGSMLVNGTKSDLSNFRSISSYVEQEDTLIGSLTVKETLYFAAKLSLPGSVGKAERDQRIDALLTSLGLQKQANTIIGTPIRKGISGGQKRRASVASQLITSPRILFLDEPTSGLDSQASYEVMNLVKTIAVKFNLIIIASIHQPSTTTFNLFDKLLLLSGGKTAYNGAVSGIQLHFASMGYRMPQYINPAEYIMELVNDDFVRDDSKSASHVERITEAWNGTVLEKDIDREAVVASYTTIDEEQTKASPFLIPLILVHRSFIKSYRDIVAYQIRIAMYMGLAIMMGTVWLRLAPEQKNIQSWSNSIFFGGAFMSFMAVAYIPAYLEDHQIYKKERQNGLYGPAAFLVANFLIGLPYLFLITILFSVIAYWLSNFQPTAVGFWTWVMWLYLDLIAAESLVVLISSLAPIFVVALAATAFANGLWMSVGGFMVSPKTLNVFWRYVFHYIDYQAYVFQGMMVNEFADRTYSCDRTPGGGCECMYPSALSAECKIDGKAVLAVYGYKTGKTGLWVGILFAIIIAYRLLAWLVLYLKKH